MRLKSNNANIHWAKVELIRAVGSILLEIVHVSTNELTRQGAMSLLKILLEILAGLDSRVVDEIMGSERSLEQ